MWHRNAHADATDEEQSSDDEAPEEVSAAAARALAGGRRKAELVARQGTSKRKRTRSAKMKASVGEGATDGNSAELELPSDLLSEVKSEALKRVEADRAAAGELGEDILAAAGASAAGSALRHPAKVENMQRR